MTACALEFATSGDGTPIAFSPTGSGTPLVLVHGTGASRDELVGAIDALILYEAPLPVGVEIYSPGVLDRLDELLERGEREAVVTTFLTDVVRVPADELALMRSRSNWPERVAAAASLVREVRAHAAPRAPRLDDPGHGGPAARGDGHRAGAVRRRGRPLRRWGGRRPMSTENEHAPSVDA